MGSENSGSMTGGRRAACNRAWDRPAGQDDSDIAALLERDDITAAFMLLVQRHGAAVYRYCRESLRDGTLADDVHQQVLIEAFRDLPRLRGRSAVRIWLFSIARHRVLDAIKMRRRAQDRLVDIATVEPPDPRPSPIDAIDDAEHYAAVAAGLGELDERARTAVVLRYQQGCSFDEMAGLCHEKAGTLHARVARALPRLRACVERLLPAAALTATGSRRACR